MGPIKRNFFFLVSLLLLLLASACEGGTTFTKTIDNKTDETIIIQLFTTYGNTEAISIHSNHSKEIYWDDQMGRFVDENYCCTQIIDSVKITITHEKTLLKDIMNPDNWLKNSKNGRNSREDCTFTITNKDLR